MPKLILPLACGFEEIEAVAVVDILRRAQMEVVTLSLEKPHVRGSHDIYISADNVISDIVFEDLDGIILPGGLPGAENLKDNQQIINLIKHLNGKNKLISAICAAPLVLEEAGVLKGKKATSYPGFEKDMGSCIYLEERVVIDNNIITARGPGAAFEFAFAVVNYFKGEDEVKNLKESMLFF